MSEVRELKKAQQQLKEAQYALKVQEAKERRQAEIDRLEWEKEKFKLQLQQEKDHWAFDAANPKLQFQEGKNPEISHPRVGVVVDLKCPSCSKPFPMLFGTQEVVCPNCMNILRRL